MNQAFNVVLGRENFADIKREYRQMEDGDLVSPPCYTALHPTRFDPSQAPSGKHVATIWQYAAHDLQGWRAALGHDQERICRRMPCAPAAVRAQCHARPYHWPICDVPSGPVGDQHLHGEGRYHGWATDAGSDGHLPPVCRRAAISDAVESLYLCGPSTHPRGGCHGANGYNCANAMADDLGIPKWWMQPERRTKKRPGRDRLGRPRGEGVYNIPRKRFGGRRRGRRRRTRKSGHPQTALERTLRHPVSPSGRGRDERAVNGVNGDEWCDKAGVCESGAGGRGMPGTRDRSVSGSGGTRRVDPQSRLAGVRATYPVFRGAGEGLLQGSRTRHQDRPRLRLR